MDVDGQARRALQVIVANPDLGPGVLSRPQVLANVLKDLLPDSPREVSVLVGAAEADLPGMLRGNLSHSLDPQTAVRLAAATLAGRAPFAPEACDWVAGELAVALGIDPALIAKPHPQAGATSLDTVVTGGAGAGYPAPGPAAPGYAPPGVTPGQLGSAQAGYVAAQPGSGPAGYPPGQPTGAAPRGLPADPGAGFRPSQRRACLGLGSRRRGGSGGGDHLLRYRPVRNDQP